MNHPDAGTDFLDALAERVADLVVERLSRPEPARDASPWRDLGGAAEYCAMSPDALACARKRGQVRAHKSSTGRYRFHVADLDQFLRAEDLAA